jgi:4'-phosphopantetheinyl transferase
MLPLPADKAHLWYVLPDELRDPALLAEYAELLTPEEAEQHMRFRFPEGRHEYLVTRALVRGVLSQYAPVLPKDWTFVRNAHGRPEIAGPGGVPRIRFNLSNTRGLIVCLVALDRDVGVDVEDTTRRGETVAVADRFFSPMEAAELRSLPEWRQRDRFFDYWTLKEAYIKARGMGLAIPLDHFSFYLQEPGSISISFAPELLDDPETWHFTLRSLTATHRLATAIRKGPEEPPVEIEERRIVPLRG